MHLLVEINKKTLITIDASNVLILLFNNIEPKTKKQSKKNKKHGMKRKEENGRNNMRKQIKIISMR